MIIPDNLDVFTYLDLKPKIKKVNCLGDQFLIHIELKKKMGFNLNAPFTIETKMAEICLSLTRWQSKMKDSIQLVWIKDIEVKKKYQRKGIFSGFCEKILANPDIEGILYDTVVNEEFASYLQRQGCHLMGTNQDDRFFSQVVKKNPSFLQLKQGVEVKDKDTLEFVHR